MKLSLILSNQNARSESRFSINSEIIENSLKEFSQVSQRMVYEGVMKEGGIKKVDISNEMIILVGHIRSIKKHRRSAKKTKTFFEKKHLERKRLNDEINTLKGAKKVTLDCTANKQKLLIKLNCWKRNYIRYRHSH